MAAPKNIDEALLTLQADPPLLTKQKAGQVGNQKTKYADLPAVNAQVLSKLNALGVTWVCLPTLLDDTASGPGRFVLRYSLKHVASGTEKAGDYPLGAGEPQKMGSAITYARRYALLAVTGIAAEDEDDDGAAAAGHQVARRAGQQRAAAPPAASGQAMQRRAARPPLPGESPDSPVGQDQHRRMHALWNELGYGGDENRDTRLDLTARLTGRESLESSSDLTRAEADTVIAKLVERKNAQGGAQ